MTSRPPPETRAPTSATRRALGTLGCGSLVLALTIAAPVALVDTTNTGLDENEAALNAVIFVPLPPIGECLSEAGQRVPIGGSSGSRPLDACSPFWPSVAPRCPEELLAPTLEAFERCQPAEHADAVSRMQVTSSMTVPNLYSSRAAIRVREGSPRCISATLDHYLVGAIAGTRYWSEPPFVEGSAGSSTYLQACLDAIEEPALRESTAESLWTLANELDLPWEAVASRLHDERPARVEYGAPVAMIEALGAARSWTADVHALLERRPWASGTPSDPLQPFEPFAHESLIAGWLVPQAELRALALHLLGLDAVPVRWRPDLDARRLESLRDGLGCVNVTWSAGSTPLRAPRVCPEGRAGVAASAQAWWLGRAILARRVETGRWPEPIDARARRVPATHERISGPVRAAWSERGISMPVRSAARFALRGRERSLREERGAAERRLLIAHREAGRVVVREIGFGLVDGEPRATYDRPMLEPLASAQGFCVGRCAGDD